MHFQLWFPGESRDAAGLLRSSGLADLADGCQETLMKMRPDGESGLLINWTGQIGFFLERQKWVDCGKYWIGLWLDSPCLPQELARSSLFHGYEVLLSDGQRWQIPLATELPATLRLVDRCWTKVRKPQFEAFWRASETWYRRLMLCDLDPETIGVREGLTRDQIEQELGEFCVTALRQNYRVTPEIVSELGLLDTQTALRIIWSVVDGLAIKEVLAEVQVRADEESAFEKKTADG